MVAFSVGDDQLEGKQQKTQQNKDDSLSSQVVIFVEIFIKTVLENRIRQRIAACS